MKHFYLFAAALAFSAVANATVGDVTEGWLSAEDFESTTENPSLFSINGSEPAGTVAIETIATKSNSDNKAAHFKGGNYDSGLEVKIALPEGKTLADYDALAFDIYNFGMRYKSIFVRIGDIVVKEPDGNDIADENDTWKHFEYPIDTEGCTDTEILVRVGFRISQSDDGVGFGLDNIVLKEKSGETPGPVEPVEYDATTNGTTVEGIYYAQDFQDKTKPGDVVTENVAIIAADPSNKKNLMAEAKYNDWNTYISLPITLPEGKTLSNYQSIEFDFCRLENDEDYKPIVLNAGDEEICTEKSKNEWPQQGEINTWTHKTYAISAESAVGNSFVLTIGLHSGAAHYAIDNIRFVERENQEPPVVEPVEYYTTQNGSTVNGTLMVNDFQHHASIVDLPMWTRGSDVVGSAKTASDPEDAKNLVAHFSGDSNYETVHEMDVTLPANKTLNDYSTITFDLYRQEDGSADSYYKRMRVQADDHIIYYPKDGGYNRHAEPNTWTKMEYEIPESTVGNNFKLRLGLESDAPDYMIDNVCLVEKRGKPTGIENVDDDLSDAPIEYYNLQGIRVSNPESGRLYIRRQGTHTTKVIM